ncbi:CPBP family intramembrane glutamic endopeptidase [Pseudooceanicola aestuarii]|uniref:CPBP family intramembrane glutamic endopeptidase n=1 Tax=Pseudooceanicola aestuarii TaxID=2697319 RepID=UPI0013D82540|nr:CPBP family intramembrane glutamic endopeptidase [Pseudooceanicola aestuarii]
MILHPPPAYAPQMALAAPARRDHRIWKCVLGVVLVEMLFSGLYGMFGLGLGRIAPQLGQAMRQGDSAAGLLIQLGAFGLMGLAVILVARALHGLAPGALMGPARIAWRDGLRALIGGLALLLTLQLLPPWLAPGEVWSTGLARWLLLLAPALLVLLVQTGSEELLYRGYVQQQLAARFPAPLVWMVLPNLLFAAAHWQNGATPGDGAQYVIWAFAFGLAASDLTARSGTLGPAIGFHLANNAYATLLFGEAGGPDSGLALLLLPGWTGDGARPGHAPVLTLSLGIEVLVIGLCWLAVRLAIRR